MIVIVNSINSLHTVLGRWARDILGKGDFWGIVKFSGWIFDNRFYQKWYTFQLRLYEKWSVVTVSKILNKICIFFRKTTLSTYLVSSILLLLEPSRASCPWSSFYITTCTARICLRINKLYCITLYQKINMSALAFVSERVYFS